MNKVIKYVLFSLVGLVGLSGCSDKKDPIVIAPLPKIANQFEPIVNWQTSIGNGVGQFYSKLSPAYANNKIFVADRNGKIAALNNVDSKTVWEIDITKNGNAKLSGGIAASEEDIYVGSEDGIVYSLAQKNGEILWQTYINAEILSSPVISDNLLMLNINDGKLIALDKDTGEQKWSIDSNIPNLTLRGSSRPTIFAGGIFWGSANGNLSAAIIDRKQLIWQHTIGTPKGVTEIDRLVDIDSSPLIFNNILYTVGYNSKMMAIDLRTASPLWERNYSSVNDLATDGSYIFLVTDKDHVIAVDRSNGIEMWQNHKLENRKLTSPVMINNYLVVGDSFGYLHWINRLTGEFVAQYNTDSSGIAIKPLVIPDGYIVTTRNGKLTKFVIN